MTYIPNKYFEKNENGLWKIIESDMTIFLNNSYNVDNIQQMILGLTTDLYQDIFKQFRQLAHCYSFQWDNFNRCELVDWSIKLNLLIIYMFSKSQKKVFPIKFKMPQKTYTYFPKYDAYSFKKSYILPPSELFNIGNQSIHIIGITLFKTIYDSSFSKSNPTRIKKSSSAQITPNRIFIILHCKIDIEKEISDNLIYISLEYDSGKLSKYIDLNIFLHRLGHGLFKYQGLTHQEFMTLTKYYNLNPYIIGDDKEYLFFTSRNKEDAELSNIVKNLNMKEVEIEDFSPEQKDKTIPRNLYQIKIKKPSKIKGGFNKKSRHKTKKQKTNFKKTIKKIKN
jgi:hypothetical protein